MPPVLLAGYFMLIIACVMHAVEIHYQTTGRLAYKREAGPVEQCNFTVEIILTQQVQPLSAQVQRQSMHGMPMKAIAIR